MGYMKIKLKETDPASRIKTKFFAIKKGEVITIDDSVKVAEERFDILEKDGKVFIKVDKLKDIDVDRLLSDNNVEEIIKNLPKLDLSYNDIQKLYGAELRKRKRKLLLKYLLDIPKPTDKGTRYTKVTIWREELMDIKGISQKTAIDIMTVFPSKDSLLKALNDNQHIPFEQEVEDGLKKAFGFFKEKEKISKPELERMRLDDYKKSNTGATTMKHFDFNKNK